MLLYLNIYMDSLGKHVLILYKQRDRKENEYSWFLELLKEITLTMFEKLDD